MDMELMRGIGEEELNTSSPYVRALVLERLEKMWRTCEPFITSEQGKPDPRFLEAGIRLVDRLMRLYRLDAPVKGSADPTEGARIDERDLVKRQVAELESRLG